MGAYQHRPCSKAVQRLLRVSCLAVLVTSAATVTGVVPASRAEAQDARSTVLVVPVQGEGVSDDLRARAVETIRGRLGSYGDLDLLDTPTTSLIDEMFELECIDLDDECLLKLSKKYKANKLLLVTLERSERGGYVVEARLYDPTAGRVASSFRRIEVPESEVRGMAEQAIGSLFGEPPAPTPVTGTIQVTASVAGARVRVGSVAAGETPFTAEITPGTYPVSVEKSGYEDFVQRVTIEAGGVETVHARMELIPIPETPPSVPETPPGSGDGGDGGTPIYKQWWFWTGIGAVVVGGIVTTVLLTQPDPGPSRGNLDIMLSPAGVDRDPVFRTGP